jgi:hypothetical protein
MSQWGLGKFFGKKESQAKQEEDINAFNLLNFEIQPLEEDFTGQLSNLAKEIKIKHHEIQT